MVAISGVGKDSWERMLLFRTFIVVIVLVSASLAAMGAPDLGWQPGQQQADFLPAEEVFRVQSATTDGAAGIKTLAQVAEGYYVYRPSLKLIDSGGREQTLRLPKGVTKQDEFFGETEVYTSGDLHIELTGAAPGPATLHWQGCADQGICYPPQTVALEVPKTAQMPRASVDEAVSETSTAPPAGKRMEPAAPTATTPAAIAQGSPDQTAPSLPAADGTPVRVDAAADRSLTTTVQDHDAAAEDQQTASRLASLGPVSAAALFFGLGLLLAFTPCTLPMIPIVSTIVVGVQATPRRAALLSSAYVLAMAATYAALGVAAGLAGSNLQATLQSPLLLGAFALLFVVLGASLFGAFELQLPAWLTRRLDRAGQRPGGSVPGAAVLGLLSALLVGPCMTAPLAGALLYIGQTGSAFHGGLALFALGVGMGLPLVLIAAFGARILPTPGPWMERVRIAFGYLMLGMAISMLSRFLPAWSALILWGLLAVAVTVGLVAWGATTQHPRLAWLVRSVAAGMGVWAVVLVAGGASGGTSVLQPLEHLAGDRSGAVVASSRLEYKQAKTVQDVEAHIAAGGRQGQWTLIDFYADWCVSCHVIERNVFGDPVVGKRLSSMQIVRPDVTRNDASDQALMKRWGVMGPPTLILIDPDGHERRAQRIVGETSAAGFLGRLDAAGVP